MKTLLVLGLAVSLNALAQNKPMPETYKIDTAVTNIHWKADKKIGSGHEGDLKVKSGTMNVNGDLITGGEIIADMNTMTCTDIPASAEENGKLIGHLKSPDFFNVEKHPEAKLVITGSEKTKKGLKIKGNLTMIGETQPVEFLATMNKKGNAITGKSNVELDRTKWNLKYGSENWFKLQADRVIKDKFTLAIDFTATK
jgi:polyisoprenoid-binding protein YceI